jgi:hypothetical protein
MELGLSSLIDKGSAAHVEESQTFNAAVEAAVRDQLQPDPATPEGLREARRMLASRPPDPRAVERIARAGGRQVPVRIITPRGARPGPPALRFTAGASTSVRQHEAMPATLSWPMRSG